MPHRSPTPVYAVPDVQHTRFFDAALEILGRDGYGALKQARLVADLGLTTGAFYHAFPSWKQFTDQLLEYWYHDRTVRTREIAEAEPDPASRLDLLRQTAVGLAHASEAAIRSWGGADPDVLRVVERVDRERLDAVIAAVRARTDDGVTADRFARTAFYVLVGYEQAASQRDPETLAWALETLQALLEDAD